MEESINSMPESDPQNWTLVMTIIAGLFGVINLLLGFLLVGTRTRITASFTANEVTNAKFDTKLDAANEKLDAKTSEVHERVDSVRKEYIDKDLCKAHRKGLPKRKDDNCDS